MRARILAAVAAMGLLLPLAGAGETRAQSTDAGVDAGANLFAPDPPTIRVRDSRPVRNPACSQPGTIFLRSWQEPYTRGNPTHEMALRRDFARRIAQERGRIDAGAGFDLAGIEALTRSRLARPIADGGVACRELTLMFSGNFRGSTLCANESPTAEQAVPGSIGIEGVTCRP